MPNGQQIPGANVLAIALAAPTDILNLATRQATEAMSMFTMKAQQLGTELVALPQALPAGLPQLPMMFPGMGAPPPVAPAGYTPPAAEGVVPARAKPGFII